MKRVALVLAMLLAGQALAEARSITMAQYVDSLQRMRSLLTSAQFDAAHAEAIALQGAEVIATDAKFHVDDSLLALIAQAHASDPALLARIELTLNELRAAGGNSPAPDPRLLQRVAAEQEVPELAPGGEVATPVVPDTPLFERIANSIERMFRWLGKKIAAFIDWILDFFPSAKSDESAITVGMRWIVIGVVALIVFGLILLAVDVTRRARRGDAQPITSAAPLRSARDADPLSRGATEWERYATQLGAEGRFREAIRAWYHAVLVTCYAAGALHFRKGRTNWEYIAMLPPSTTWRPELIRLTQRFEQEWYGAEESTSDALDDCSTRAREILAELQHYERGAA